MPTRLSRRDLLRWTALAATTLCIPRSQAAPAHIRPQANQPHIVMTIVDSLRPDHLSSYGYNRQTTPELDSRLAQRGTRFSHAISAGPWTWPANAAITTGVHPFRFGNSWDEPTLPLAFPTLAERLKAAGYTTAGFMTAYYASSRFGFQRGFDLFDDELALTRTTATKGRVTEVNSRALDWLNTVWKPQLSAQGPLFLLLYYYEPHVYFLPPAPYDTRYDPSYTGSFTGTTYANGKEVILGQLVPTARDVEHLRALYDGEISFWDAEYAKLLDQLEPLLGDQTLWALTADHGEAFGEHSMWVHGQAIYEEVIRVPLLLRGPGIPANQVINTAVENIDIHATLLESAGLTVPAGMEAQSLWPVLRGETVPRRVIFSRVDGLSQRNHPLAYLAPPTPRISATDDGWKLIVDLGGTNPDELYQLEPQSLYEQLNRASAEPTRVQQLRQAIQNWLNRDTVLLSTVLR